MSQKKPRADFPGLRSKTKLRVGLEGENEISLRMPCAHLMHRSLQNAITILEGGA
jgi:hypothetical protein